MLCWPRLSPRSIPSASALQPSALLLAAITLLSTLIFLPPLTVRAASLVINCNDSGAGSLRDAIATSPSGTTITFQAGLNCSSTGSGPILLTSGTLTIGTNLTIDGTGHSVVVDGGCTISVGRCSGGGGVTVFTVSGGVTASLTALTIQHGGASPGGGGGIQNAGMLNVTKCTVSNNVADGTLTGTDANARGGGILNGGTLTVRDSTVGDNISNGGSEMFGGGIYNAGALTVMTSTISNNSAGSGGGIYNASTANVINSTLSGNLAGAIFGAFGGGIYNSGALTVTGSTFSGNKADTNFRVSPGVGGGIYNDAGTVIVTNSTFSGNIARNNSGCCAQGGGIYNTGTLAATNVTISGNVAGTGGGIYTSNAVALTDTIVVNSGAAADLFVTGSGTFTGNYNMVDDSTFNLLMGGHNIVSLSPKLGALGNNGGPTQTIPLLAGSPAIDVGGVACPATDQRGIPRPQGAACDIGAYEFVVVPPSLPSPRPAGPPAGSNPAPLPQPKPAGAPAGSVPNPLPPPRP